MLKIFFHQYQRQKKNYLFFEEMSAILTKIHEKLNIYYFYCYLNFRNQIFYKISKRTMNFIFIKYLNYNSLGR